MREIIIFLPSVGYIPPIFVLYSVSFMGAIATIVLPLQSSLVSIQRREFFVIHKSRGVRFYSHLKKKFILK